MKRSEITRLAGGFDGMDLKCRADFTVEPKLRDDIVLIISYSKNTRKDS